MKRTVLIPIVLMLCSPIAAAGDPECEPKIGAETRAWFNLHKSGAQASPTPGETAGDVADRIYQRYLDSFSHPIPEQFARVGISEDN